MSSCVVRGKSFKETAKRLNISEGLLNIVAYDYINQEGTSGFPSDSYILSKIYGEPNLITVLSLRDLYNKEYSIPRVFDTVDEAVKYKEEAAKFFPPNAVPIVETNNGKFIVQVNLPVEKGEHTLSALETIALTPIKEEYRGKLIFAEAGTGKTSIADNVNVIDSDFILADMLGVTPGYATFVFNSLDKATKLEISKKLTQKVTDYVLQGKTVLTANPNFLDAANVIVINAAPRITDSRTSSAKRLGVNKYSDIQAHNTTRLQVKNSLDKFPDKEVHRLSDTEYLSNVISQDKGFKQPFESQKASSIEEAVNSVMQEFGISVNTLQEYDNDMPLFDALNRAINVKDPSNITEGVGYAIAFMMQRDLNINEYVVRSLLRKYGPTYFYERRASQEDIESLIDNINHKAYVVPNTVAKVIGRKQINLSDIERYAPLKDAVLKELGKQIAYSLQAYYSGRVAKQSIVGRVWDIIANFFDKIFNGNRKHSLEVEIVDNITKAIINKDYSIIRSALIKPGTTEKSVVVNAEKELREHPFEDNVIRKLSDKGIAIAGSLSLATQGTVLRPENSSMHDLDFEAREVASNRAELEEILKGTFDNFSHLRTIIDKTKGLHPRITGEQTHSYLVLDRPFTLGERNAEGVREIFDAKTNEVLGTFSHKNSNLDLNEGIQGKVLDFFVGKSNEKLYSPVKQITLNGKEYLISPAENTLYYKLSWQRPKDLFDYRNFIPYDEAAVKETTPYILPTPDKVMFLKSDNPVTQKQRNVDLATYLYKTNTDNVAKITAYYNIARTMARDYNASPFYDAINADTEESKLEEVNNKIKEIKRTRGFLFKKIYPLRLSSGAIKIVLVPYSVDELLNKGAEEFKNWTNEELVTYINRMSPDRGNQLYLFYINPKKQQQIYDEIARKTILAEYYLIRSFKFLKELADDKENNAYVECCVRWLKNGTITLPRDNELVRNWFDIARKHNLDVQNAKSPFDLFEQLPKKNVDIDYGETFDPTKYDHLTFAETKVIDGKKVDIYNVEDSLDGQQDLAQALADCLPRIGGESIGSSWCISTYNTKVAPGEKVTLSPHAISTYWPHYSVHNNRQLAIYNGKPHAMRASSTNMNEWWDMQDWSHIGLENVPFTAYEDRINKKKRESETPHYENYVLGNFNFIKGDGKTAVVEGYSSLDDNSTIKVRVFNSKDYAFLSKFLALNPQNLFTEIRKNLNSELYRQIHIPADWLNSLTRPYSLENLFLSGLLKEEDRTLYDLTNNDIDYSFIQYIFNLKARVPNDLGVRAIVEKINNRISSNKDNVEVNGLSQEETQFIVKAANDIFIRRNREYAVRNELLKEMLKSPQFNADYIFDLLIKAEEVLTPDELSTGISLIQAAIVMDILNASSLSVTSAISLSNLVLGLDNRVLYALRNLFALRAEETKSLFSKFGIEIDANKLVESVSKVNQVVSDSSTSFSNDAEERSKQIVDLWSQLDIYTGNLLEEEATPKQSEHTEVDLFAQDVNEYQIAPQISTQVIDHLIDNLGEESLAERYNRACQDVINKDLNKKVHDILRKYHFEIIEADLQALFGDNSQGALDFLLKVVYLSNRGNKDALTDVEEFSHAFIKMMGSVYHQEQNRTKFPETALYSELRDLIEKTTLYKQTYELYKDTYKYKGKNEPNEVAIKEEAVGKALALAITERYKAHTQEDASFFAKVKEWLSKALDTLARIFTGKSKVEELKSELDILQLKLNDIADSILDDTYYKKFLKKINEKGLTLQDYRKTILDSIKKDGGKALEILLLATNNNLIITGSMANRYQGTIYRKSMDSLHDIDIIVPLSVHSLHNRYPQLHSVTGFGDRALSKEAILDLIRDTQSAKNVLDVYRDKYGEDFHIISAFASDGKLILNTMICEDPSLAERFANMSGKFNERLENFTKKEREKMYLVDFFFNGEDPMPNQVLYDDEFNLSLSYYTVPFEEKLKFGRGKDLYDYIHYRPFRQNHEFSQNMLRLLGSDNSISTEKAGIGVNLNQLIALLGQSMYKNNVLDVDEKELVQNSFDAVKQALYNKEISKGKIDVTINTQQRTLTIEDNGVGMSPEVIKKAYLTIGGSNKGEMSNALKSGGLGLAKVAYLFSSERVDLETVHNGIRTVVSATPAQMYSGEVELYSFKTDAPNGTKVTLTIPKTYETAAGEQKAIDFYSYGDGFFKNPLIGNVEVTRTVINDLGKKRTWTRDFNKVPEGYTKIGVAKSAFGDIEIYKDFSRESGDVRVLNSGLYQFSNNIWDFEAKQYSTILNILPSVSTDSRFYPIANQRESFRDTVKPEIGDLYAFLQYIDNLYQRGKLKKSFSLAFSADASSLENLNQTKDEDTNATVKEIIEKLREKRRSNLTDAEDAEDSAEDFGIALKTISKIVAGLEERKSSLDTSGIDLGENTRGVVDTSNLDINKPIFYNNTDFKPSKPTVELLNSLGARMVQFKKALLALNSDSNAYKKITLNMDSLYFGIALDTSYNGVNVNPSLFNFIGLNPLSMAYAVISEIGTDNFVDTFTEIFYHNLLHEINHNAVGNHNVQFTALFLYTEALAASLGDALRTWKNAVRELVKQHYKELIEDGQKFRDSSNVGDVLEGGGRRQRTTPSEAESLTDNEQAVERSQNQGNVSELGELLRGKSKQLGNLERVNIKELAINNGTFMKAPNGKPSLLNEQLWVEVRTKAFKDWFGDWEKPTIFTANNVNDVQALMLKYPSKLPHKYYHHSTNSFGKQSFDLREGTQERLHIIGRLTTDKVDVLLVENPNSSNPIAHITLAVADGVRPVESNSELQKYSDKIQPLDDYVETTFTNNLDRNISKVVDENGEPLVVYHGSRNGDFTTFSYDYLRKADSGFFFTSDPSYAELFGNTKLYFLNIKNPNVTKEPLNIDSVERLLTTEYKEGTDGIQGNDSNGKSENLSASKGTEFVVLRPNQIKSATDNEGTYSSESDNTLFGLNTDELVFNNSTLSAVRAMADAMGVDIRFINLGRKDALAAANFLEKTIDITETYPDRVQAWNKLPEEVAHWWYRLLANDSQIRKLLAEHKKTIKRANKLELEKYGNYTDRQAFVEEAIGQLIAEEIHNRENKENKGFFARVWEIIKDILAKYKLYKREPFFEAATRILNSNMSELVDINEIDQMISTVPNIESENENPQFKNVTLVQDSKLFKKIQKQVSKLSARDKEQIAEKYIINKQFALVLERSARDINNSESMKPYLYSMDSFLKKYKDGIFFNDLISVKNAKKVELAIYNKTLNYIKEYADEYKGKKSIPLEDFLVYFDTILNDEYLLQFAPLSNYNAYRIVDTFLPLRAEDNVPRAATIENEPDYRYTSSENRLTPEEEKTLLFPRHNKVGLWFNSTLPSASLFLAHHFSTNPYAFGSLVYFNDGNSVLMHEILSDIFEKINNLYELESKTIDPANLYNLTYVPTTLLEVFSGIEIDEESGKSKEEVLASTKNYIDLKANWDLPMTEKQVREAKDKLKQLEYLLSKLTRNTVKRRLSKDNEAAIKRLYEEFLKVVDKDADGTFMPAYEDLIQVKREWNPKDTRYFAFVDENLTLKPFFSDETNRVLFRKGDSYAQFKSKLIFSLHKSLYKNKQKEISSIKSLLANFYVQRSKKDYAKKLQSLKSEDIYRLYETFSKTVTSTYELFVKEAREKEKREGIAEVTAPPREIVTNYFYPLVHHLILTAIAERGRGVKIFFPGYRLTKNLQGDGPTLIRTANIYATPMDVLHGYVSQVGPLFSLLSKLKGVKLEYVENIEGLKGDDVGDTMDGYMLDISNYNLSAPALYGLKPKSDEELQLQFNFEEEENAPEVTPGEQATQQAVTNVENISDRTEAYGVEVINGSREMKAASTNWQTQHPEGIVAYRKYSDSPKTFTAETVSEGWIGNPFSVATRGEDTVQKFYDWIVTGNNFGESRASESFRQAIISKILNTPDNSPILYYTELNRPSHATVIGYLVNNKDVLNNTNPLENLLAISNTSEAPQTNIVQQQTNRMFEKKTAENKAAQIGIFGSVSEEVSKAVEVADNFENLADDVLGERTLTINGTKDSIKLTKKAKGEIEISFDVEDYNTIDEEQQNNLLKAITESFDIREVLTVKKAVTLADLDFLKNLSYSGFAKLPTETTVKVKGEDTEVLVSLYYKTLKDNLSQRNAKYALSSQRIVNLLNALLRSGFFNLSLIREYADNVAFYTSDFLNKYQQDPSLLFKHFPEKRQLINNEYTEEAQKADIEKVKNMTRPQLIRFLSTGENNLLTLVREVLFGDLNLNIVNSEDLTIMDEAELLKANFEALVKLSAPTFGMIELFTLSYKPGKSETDKIEVNDNLEYSAADVEDVMDLIEVMETRGNSQEHWQVAVQSLDNLLTASLKVKTELLNCFILVDSGEKNEDGSPKYIVDPKAVNKFGMAGRISPRAANESLLKWLYGSKNLEVMVERLKKQVQSNPWVSQLLPKLTDTTGEYSDFQSQFFSTFCKAAELYSIVIKDGDTFKSIFCNRETAFKSIRDNITTLYSINRHPLFTSKGVNLTSLRQLNNLANKLEGLKNKPKDKRDMNEEVGLFKEVLHLLGVDTIEDLYISTALNNDSDRETMITNISNLSKVTIANSDNKNWEPFAFSNNTKDKGIAGFLKKIISPMSTQLGYARKSSFYESGKTRQTFILPSFLTTRMNDLSTLTGAEFENLVLREYGSSQYFRDSAPNFANGWLNPWLKQLVNMSDEMRAKVLGHKTQIRYNRNEYMKRMSPAEYSLSVIAEYFCENVAPNQTRGIAWYRVPMLSNKQSSEFISFYKYIGDNYKESIKKDLSWVLIQEFRRMQTSLIRENKGITKGDPRAIVNFDGNAKFSYLTYLQPYLEEKKDTELGKLINQKITGERDLTKELRDRLIELFKEETEKFLDDAATAKIQQWRDRGVLEQAMLIPNVGNTEAEAEANLRNFYWNDFLAAINILQLTVTDPSFFSSTEDLQKRLAQLHAPGIRGNDLARDYGDPENGIPPQIVSDGIYRTLILDDEIVISNIIDNVTEVIDRKIKNAPEHMKAGYEALKETIIDGLKEVKVTDGQGFNSPSSYRKKAIRFGKWSKESEEVYKKLLKGDYKFDELKTAFLPLKPFVYGLRHEDLGSSAPITSIPVPTLIKDSEYLLIMADALLMNENTTQPNLLRAIYNFMESTYEEDPTKGIDAIVFKSAVKNGIQGVIQISDLVNDIDGERKLRERLERAAYVLTSVNTEKGTHTLSTKEYNPVYVKSMDYSYYTIQLEIPSHYRDHYQGHGSQGRILAVSELDQAELPNGITFKDGTKEKTLPVKDFVWEYESTIADNINEDIGDFKEEFCLTDEFSPYDLKVALSNALMKEIFDSPRYGVDLALACSIEDGDFRIPINDYIQSRRIEQLGNSIIKNRINKQEILGGPAVQVSNFGMSKQLHLRFKDSEGNILPTKEEWEKKNEGKKGTYKEFLDNNQASIAYYECLAPIPSNSIFELFADKDGNIDLDAIEIVAPDLLKALAYRIPTQDKYSMIPAKIVGFMPKEAGDTFVLPYEITSITGADFDIDKVMVMLLKQYLGKKDVNKLSKSDMAKLKKLLVKELSKYYKESNAEFNDVALRYINNEAASRIAGINMDFNKKVSEITKRFEKYDYTKELELQVAEHKITEALKNRFIKQHEHERDRAISLAEKQRDKELAAAKKRKQDLINNLDKIGIQKRAEMYVDEFLEVGRWHAVKKDNPIEKVLRRKYLDFVFSPVTPTKGRDYRNNKIVNMIYSSLTSEAAAFLILNPESFEKEKRIGYKIAATKLGHDYASLDKLSTKELKKLSYVDKNLCLFDTQEQYYYQNSAAAATLSMFAVQRVAHAFLRGMGFKIAFKGGIHPDGEFRLDGWSIPNVVEFDPLTNFLGERIGRDFGDLVGSSADAAKDPIQNLMNIISHTVGALSFMLRAGIPFESAALLLSQDIVSKVLDTYYKDNLTKYSSLQEAVKKEMKRLGKEGKFDINPDSPTATSLFKEHLDRETLIKGLNSSTATMEGNFKALVFLDKVLDATEDMQTLTFPTRLNSISSAVGPLIVDNLILEHKLSATSKTLLNKHNLLFTALDIYDEHPILGAFSLGSALARAIFKSFPAYQESFIQAVNLDDNLAERFYNDRELLKSFADFYASYLFIANKVIDENDLEYYITKFPEEFLNSDAKERYPNNLLILSIVPRREKKYNNRLILKLDDSFAQEDEGGKLSSAWADLHAINPELSTKLFIYNFFRGGLAFNPRTMMSLVSIFVKEKLFMDSKTGKSRYLETLRHLPLVDSQAVLDLFVRNNWEDPKLVSRIDKEDTLNTSRYKYDAKEKTYNILGEEEVNKYKDKSYIRVFVNKQMRLFKQIYAYDKVLQYGEVKPLGNRGEYLEMSNTSLITTYSPSVDEISKLSKQEMLAGVEEALITLEGINTIADAKKAIDTLRNYTLEHQESIKNQMIEKLKLAFENKGMHLSEKELLNIYDLMCE